MEPIQNFASRLSFYYSYFDDTRADEVYNKSFLNLLARTFEALSDFFSLLDFRTFSFNYHYKLTNDSVSFKRNTLITNFRHVVKVVSNNMRLSGLLFLVCLPNLIFNFYVTIVIFPIFTVCNALFRTVSILCDYQHYENRYQHYLEYSKPIEHQPLIKYLHFDTVNLQKKSELSVLSLELQQLVFSFLGVKDLPVASKVCKWWYQQVAYVSSRPEAFQSQFPRYMVKALGEKINNIRVEKISEVWRDYLKLPFPSITPQENNMTFRYSCINFTEQEKRLLQQVFFGLFDSKAPVRIFRGQEGLIVLFHINDRSDNRSKPMPFLLIQQTEGWFLHRPSTPSKGVIDSLDNLSVLINSKNSFEDDQDISDYMFRVFSGETLGLLTKRRKPGDRIKDIEGYKCYSLSNSHKEI